MKTLSGKINYKQMKCFSLHLLEAI